MMRRWSEDQTLKFVGEYIKNECLWKMDHKLYKSKAGRHRAYADIARIMDIPDFGVREIPLKIKNLRCTYVQELKKISDSKLCDSEDVYVPRLRWFSLIDNALKLSHRNRYDFEAIINPEDDIKVEKVEFLDVSTFDTEHVPTLELETMDTFDEENDSNSVYSLPKIPSDVVKRKRAAEPRQVVTSKHPKNLPSFQDPDSPSTQFVLEPRPIVPKHQNNSSICHDSDISNTSLLPEQSENICLRKHLPPINKPYEENEFELFGRMIGKQLKSMPLPAALKAQQHIQNYITDLRLERLLGPKKKSKNETSQTTDM